MSRSSCRMNSKPYKLDIEICSASHANRVQLIVDFSQTVYNFKGGELNEDENW